MLVMPVAISAGLDDYFPIFENSGQKSFGTDTDLYSIGVDDQVRSFYDGNYRVLGSTGGWEASISTVPTNAHSQFTAILLPCTGTTLSICIDEVSYRKATDSSWKQATLVTGKSFTRTAQLALTYQDGSSQNFGTFAEDLSQGRPAGGEASIWSMDGAVHKGGNEYLLSVSISDFPRGIVRNPTDLSVGIRPIRVTNVNDVRTYAFPNNVRQYQFPKGFEYRVTIKLGPLLSKITKWYSARLNSSGFKITDDKLEISGEPVWVPLATSVSKKCDSLTPEEKAAVMLQWNYDNFTQYCKSGGVGVTMFSEPGDNGYSGFQIFRTFEPYLFEAGKNSVWSFEARADLAQCNAENVSGFISSNAMLFTPNPPAFDAASQSLVYQMASPHFDRNGQVNVGNLDLVLNKSVAECLWKSIPPELYEAQITILNSNGDSLVGTSTVTSNGDWIHVNVTNFSFSSPTLKVRLVSSKPTPTPTPTPTNTVLAPSPKSTVSTSPTISKSPTLKKATIECIKGKLVKRVTAVKPKCPSGYKKR